MQNLISQAQIVATPIGEGDAGIILRADGSFQIFNCHSDLDPQNLTERQIEQGETLQALSVALQIPQVMEVLLRMASDPAIVGDTVDVGPKH